MFQRNKKINNNYKLFIIIFYNPKNVKNLGYVKQFFLKKSDFLVKNNSSRNYSNLYKTLKMLIFTKHLKKMFAKSLLKDLIFKGLLNF